MGGKFKFQVQDSDLEYVKNTSHFLKIKPPLKIDGHKNEKKVNFCFKMYFLGQKNLLCLLHLIQIFASRTCVH